MKRVLIAITLLLSGALLTTPIINAMSQKDQQVNIKPVKVEQVTNSENIQVIKDNEEKEEVQSGMTKSEAESVLNKYIEDIEKADFTYTYQGDENTFESIKEKGIRGYVFLPNIETDMAYLVDKDNGSIYFFHPSGYFELL